MMEYRHIPVLLREVIDSLELEKGDMVVDCTLGGAGYAQVLAEKVGPTGRIFAFDLDGLAIANAEQIKKEKGLDQLILIHDSFHNIQEALEGLGVRGGLKAIVMDLGLSSAQLDDRRRGFSFQHDGPLDMSFGGSGEEFNQTSDIVNSWKEERLAAILRDYGEERHSRSIARAIVKARREKRLERILPFLEIIRSAIPVAYANDKRIHFATRTFQALRIASNDELEGLRRTLPLALELLAPGGRLAVVSFHSLEDRIVKEFIRKESRNCLCPPELPVCRCGHEARLRPIVKKPIVASRQEEKSNPRSRSAKLRVAEKI